MKPPSTKNISYALVWLIALSLCGFSYSAFAQGRPTFVVLKKEKPANCPGGGLNLIEGYIKASNDDAFIEIDIFFQEYDGSWVRKNYTRKGSGKLMVNESSCDYTGNFYSFAYYTDTKVPRPTIEDVNRRHAQMGDTPRFRMTKKSKPENCEQGGVFFEQGEIYTPKGERVILTLFMEKNDGSWRKKDFRFVGSRFIEIDIEDCNLTGNYKSRVSIQ